MTPRYREAIDHASAALSHALLEDIPALVAQGRRLDALGRELPRPGGPAVLSARSQGLWAYLGQHATARGLTVQRRPRVRFTTVGGEVDIAAARGAPDAAGTRRLREAHRGLEDGGRGQGGGPRPPRAGPRGALARWAHREGPAVGHA
jgi:hypothetical protein